MRLKDFIFALVLTVLVIISIELTADNKLRIQKLQREVIDIKFQMNEIEAKSKEYLTEQDIQEYKDQVESNQQAVQECMDELMYLRNDFSGWQGVWDALFSRKQEHYMRTH